MAYVLSYLSSLAVFLVVDALWIKLVTGPVFARALGPALLESPRLGVAAGFYAIYVGLVFYFAVLPAADAGAWRIAALNGALLGLLAYGTYEATNFATLRGWTAEMLAIDLGWGVLLTAVAAITGYLVLRIA